MKKPDRKLVLAATVLAVGAATAVGQQAPHPVPTPAAYVEAKGNLEGVVLRLPAKRSTALGGL